MDFIDSVYQHLSSQNLAQNMSDYSNRWLGMERSYYRNKLCKQRSASARVYGFLAKKLMQEATARRLNGEVTKARDFSNLATGCICNVIYGDPSKKNNDKHHAH